MAAAAAAAAGAGAGSGPEAATSQGVDDSVDLKHFDEFYAHVIDPFLLYDNTPALSAVDRVQAAITARMNETLRLAAQCGAKTFTSLYDALKDSTEFSARSFRCEYEHLAVMVGDVRHFKDPFSGAQRDLLAEIPVAATLSADKLIRARVYSLRLHLPYLGLVDQAQIQREAVAITRRENCDLSHDSCLKYATAVREYTGFEQSLAWVPQEVRLIDLGPSPVRVPSVKDDRHPMLNVPPYTDALYERPAEYASWRSAIAEFRSLPDNHHERAVQYKRLLDTVAKHHATCDAARIAAKATLDAAIKQYTSAWISIRAAGAIHAQLCHELGLLNRAATYAHTRPELIRIGTELRAVIGALTAAEVDHKSTIAQLQRCVPTNIPAIWEHYCRELMKFYDAETMTRDLRAAFVFHKSVEWSSATMAAALANHGAFVRQSFVGTINGEVPIALMQDGLNAIRVSTATGAQLWNEYWSYAVPAQVKRLASRVVDAERQFIAVRFSSAARNPVLLSARQWLHGYSQFDVSGRQACVVPSAVHHKLAIVGDSISVLMPGNDTMVDNASAVRHALIAFACGQKKKESATKQQQQQKKKKHGGGL